MVARSGAGWHLAHSLQRLVEQVDAAYPNRSRASDGSIASTQHHSANPTSDHEIRSGLVTAVDISHDPAHGADMAKVAAALVASRDPRIKYVIFNRRICDSRPQYGAWQWKPYSGSNPHDHHMHVSVLMVSADDTRPWRITAAVPPPAVPPAGPILEGDDVTNDDIQKIADAVAVRLGVVGRSVQHTEAIAGADAVRDKNADADTARRLDGIETQLADIKAALTKES
jgi:hypothetical protein